MRRLRTSLYWTLLLNLCKELRFEIRPPCGTKFAGARWMHHSFQSIRFPFSEKFPVIQIPQAPQGGFQTSEIEFFGRDIPSPPPSLWVQGSEKALRLLPELETRGLAIVGTRTPQERVTRLTRSWVENLRHRNIIIVSGFARGIDETAHRAAVEADLPTVAILGTALNKNYPAAHHQELRLKILEGDGLILSEISPEDIHAEYQFLKRNRLIAALSRATVIAQSAEKSGALNTAEWAQRLGRSLFATPSFPGDPFLLGNQRLLAETYARPIFDARCLSSVWLELTSAVPSKLKVAPKKREEPLPASVEKLLTQIKEQTHSQGGCDLFVLQSRFCAHAKDYPEFFVSLQELLKRKLISEENSWYRSL